MIIVTSLVLFAVGSGHLKQIKPNIINNMMSNKPDRRCFGHYRCNKCGTTWMSAYCWPGEYQQCKSCGGPVYAFKRNPLENPDGLDKCDMKVPHRAELCGKCKKLGYNCQNI